MDFNTDIDESGDQEGPLRPLKSTVFPFPIIEPIPMCRPQVQSQQYLC